MLSATVMGGFGEGEHVHADMLRPDRIIRTGVIEPYPLTEWNPLEIARKVLEPFAQMGPGGAGVPADPSPEEIVEQARNYAAVARQGVKMPPWLSRQAMAAIAALLKGVPFVVTAQGRSLLVKPTNDQTTVNGLGQPPFLQPIQSMVPARIGPGPANYLPMATLPGYRQEDDRQPMFLSVR